MPVAADIKPESIDFGVVIAFLAPGFVAFKALSSVSPMASEWLNLSAHGQQNLGVFLFVGLASLSLGLAVSGVRALLLDYVFFRLLDARQPPVDWKKVKDAALLITVRDGYYRYFQFYGNVAVAVAALLLAFRGSFRWQLLCWGGVAVSMLLLSAFGSLRGYIRALEDQEILKKRKP